MKAAFRNHIGANLADGMYSGIYNGTQKHVPDLKSVLARSWKVGLQKIIITGTDLKNCREAVELAKSDDRLFSTVGCHPTNCNQIEEHNDSSLYLDKLTQLYAENKKKIVALGEFGLDFDRLQFCSRETQLKNAADELINILSKNKDRFVGGVVHSFDGDIHQARKIVDLGLFIGLNGCSLKTDDNLKVVQELPRDRILLETDSPWCEVRPTHAGYKYIETKFDSVKKEKWDIEKMVKGRNEPCTISQILEIVSRVRGEDKYELGQLIYENTEKLFFSRL